MMQRIEKIDPASASQEATGLLDAVKVQMGGVPAIIQTMAQSPTALAGYLGFAGALGDGVLPATLREQLALAIAGVNHCDYCASAHTAIGRKLGIDRDEVALNLSGKSQDPKTAAALTFVRRIVEQRGQLPDADVSAVRDAGYSDEEIVEMIANTALNIFTNYFNHIAATEIDFPLVETARTEAA